MARKKSGDMDTVVLIRGNYIEYGWLCRDSEGDFRGDDRTGTFACGEVVNRYFELDGSSRIFLCITADEADGAVRTPRGHLFNQSYWMRMDLRRMGWIDTSSRTNRDLYWWVEIPA